MKIIAASMINETVTDHNMKNYFVRGLNEKLRAMMHAHPLKSFKNAQDLALDFEMEMDAQAGGHDSLLLRLQEEIRELKQNQYNRPFCQVGVAEEESELEALRKEVARLKLRNSREEETTKKKDHAGRVTKWCHICEENSHTTKECELNPKNSALHQRDKWCHICDVDTHMTKDCFYNPRGKAYRGRGRGRGGNPPRNVYTTRGTQEPSRKKPPMGRCLICLQFGHWKSECPTKQEYEQKPFVCNNCGPSDHKTEDCKGKAKATNLMTIIPETKNVKLQNK